VHITEVIATTVPGIEDIALIEASRKLRLLRGYARLFSGHVYLAYVCSLEEATRLRTVERVGVSVGVWRLRSKTLNEVIRLVSPHISNIVARYGGLMSTWGVTCERAGVHDFASGDVEREVGALIRRVINLARPDVELRIDIAEDEVYVWVPNRRILRNRPYRRAGHESAINPVLAHAMAMLLKPEPGETVCDLTCGSGTLLAEAYYVEPRARYVCMDIEQSYAKIALTNLDWIPNVDVLTGDATKTPIIRCDAFIMNPPYGIRMRKPRNLYTRILRAMWDMAKEGARAIWIAPSMSEVLKSVKGLWRIVWGRPVYQGGRWTWIIAMRKT